MGGAHNQMIVHNALLDIFAAIMTMIPIAYLASNERWRHRSNQFFLGIAASNIVMIACDMLYWMLLSPVTPAQSIFLLLFSAFYYVSGAFVLFFSAQYLIAYIKLEGRLRQRYLLAVAVMCGVQILLALASAFTGSIFYAADGRLRRGPLFIVLLAVPLLCYIFFAALVYVSRRNLRRGDVLFFLLYILVPLGAGATQAVFNSVTVINTGVSFVLLFTLVNIQFEQEMAIKEQEKELANQRIDIMLSQIQPHFLYNSLSVIYNLCETDPEAAKKAVQRFSEFLRGNMDSLKARDPIPFARELNHVMNYLYLEQQRFGDKLQVIYRIKFTDFLIPALTLQPLVENAVQHGILNKKNGGSVTILTDKVENCAMVTVSDNGVGFEKAKLYPSTGNHAHIGIDNVRKRLKESVDGSLEVVSSDQGTTAIIRIPWNGDDEA